MNNPSNNLQTQARQPMGDDIPAVVAIVVAKDPGDHFEDMLYSLGAQDYENISVLVIDAGSDEPLANRVADVLPDAYLHRIAGNPGWSVAANQSMELVSGSPFLLFCHDDVILEKSCVSILMSEVYKTNAGIVGPKLVNWDDPRKLLQIGMNSDRFGVQVDQVDRGEFDQQQYDSPKEVFCIPGGVQLIRSDLLAAVGGFDEEIAFIGEDLDICWRAQVVGAKVRVVPKAKAKHRECSTVRISTGTRRELKAKHRLRTVRANNTGFYGFFNSFLAYMLIILEGLYALFNGRRKHASEVFSAVPWNLSRLRSTRKRRKQLDKNRKVSDKEIHKKQVPGSAQISGFWRNKFEQGQSRLDSVLSTPSATAVDPTSSFHASVILLLTIFIVFFASRSILISGYSYFGQIPHVGSPLELLREWTGSWRTAGAGGSGNAPLAYSILGGLRVLFFWSPSFFQKLLIIIPIFIGLWGGTRIARPFGSARMRAVAGTLYVLNPIVFWMIRAGQWDSLIIWSTAPFLLTSIFKVANIEPFAARPGSDDSYFVERTFPARLLRAGILVAFISTFAPSVVPVAIILCVALAISSVTNFENFKSYIFATLTVIAVPAVLHIPWSLDIARQFSWSWLVGAKSSEASQMNMVDIIFFRTSFFDSSGTDNVGLNISSEILFIGGMVLPICALLALLIVRIKTGSIIIPGWVLAITIWLFVWLESVDFLPFSLPAAESMLPLAALGLILVVVAASVEIEQFYLKSVSRSRHLLLGFGIFGLVIVFLAGSVMSVSGRWAMPVSPRRASVSALSDNNSNEEGEVQTEGRVLWIGHPSVIPADSYRTEEGITYAVTDRFIDVRDKWVPGPLGRTKGIGVQIDLAAKNSTANLGALLAPYGVKYVVISEEIARGYKPNKIDPNLFSSLSRQLDLRLDQSGSSNFTIYRNLASSGVAAGLDSPADADARTQQDQLQIDLGKDPVSAMRQTPYPNRWTVDMPADKDVFVSLPFEGVKVSGARTNTKEGFDKFMVLESGQPGVVQLIYPNSFITKLLLVIQLFLIASAVVVGQTRKGAEQ